jgi:hypothetical protein
MLCDYEQVSSAGQTTRQDGQAIKMTTISRSLWFICIIVFLGLDILGSEALGKPIQAVGFWLSATGLLYGCGAMVLWPRQLVASKAGSLGTRHPGVARGFGVFGLLMAGLFEALAGSWSGYFHWPTFVVACAASGMCAAVALRNLGKKLNAVTDQRASGPTGAQTSGPCELS